MLLTYLRLERESLELCESTEAERCRGAGGGRLLVGEPEYKPRRAGAERVDRGDPPGTGIGQPNISPLMLQTATTSNILLPIRLSKQNSK